MIELRLSEEKYEYDIRGLLTAFYPGEEIEKKEWELWEGKETDSSGTWRRQLLVAYGPEQIRAVLCGRDAAGEPSARRRLAKTVSVSGLECSAVKNALKRLVYGLLREDTRRELPWGTLTGIRPTKIALGLLEEGKEEAEIAAYMQREYLVTPEKTGLSLEIARRERQLLRGIDYENGFSLYVGVPFCPTTCLYCSFQIGRAHV